MSKLLTRELPKPVPACDFMAKTERPLSSEQRGERLPGKKTVIALFIGAVLAALFGVGVVVMQLLENPIARQ